MSLASLWNIVEVVILHIPIASIESCEYISVLPRSSCYCAIPILAILNHCGTYIVYVPGDGRFGVRSCFYMILVAGILGIVDVYLHLLTQLE